MEVNLLTIIQQDRIRDLITTVSMNYLSLIASTATVNLELVSGISSSTSLKVQCDVEEMNCSDTNVVAACTSNTFINLLLHS